MAEDFEPGADLDAVVKAGAVCACILAAALMVLGAVVWEALKWLA
jgi:hypothetical protein